MTREAAAFSPRERKGWAGRASPPVAALPGAERAVASSAHMRHESTADDIHRFMQRFGVAVRAEGRVYFTGGVSAVLHGWRPMTVDIDLRADPEPAGFFEAIRLLKDQLELNLELACPSDFIPPLPGWRERSLFIARHGRLDFYHYD